MKNKSNIDISETEINSNKDPYNTYYNKGLPPGPIGNPGDDAMKAALESDRRRLVLLRGDRRRGTRPNSPRRMPNSRSSRKSSMTRSRQTDARRAAVLGSPIAHSLSPVLHRAAYAELGLTGWTYDRFEVDEAALPGFLGGLGARVGRAVADHAAQARRDPAAGRDQRTAASVEAVNTVVFTEDGRRLGDNTDIPGMVAALRERGIEQVEPPPILGAGATASSALAALSRICTGEVTAYVRSEARAAEMRQWGERLGVDGAHGGLGGRRPRRCDAPLVDRHHPGGRHRRARRRPSPGAPARSSTCCTSRGRPRSPPPGRAHGGAVVSGLDLLVHQAVLQVEQMTGRVAGAAGRHARGGRAGARRPRESA